MRHSIVIRADGGHGMGTGHIARMARLADRLRDSGSTVTFVSRALDGCAGILESGRHECVPLPAGAEGASAQAASVVCGLEPDLVVHDIRDTSAAIMRQVRACGARTVNFDDRGSGAALADVLVDANRLPEEADTVPEAQALVGPEYIGLDPAFERAHDRPRSVGDRVEEVLVFMGGADPAGLTLKALEGLAPLGPPWHTTVVLGYAYGDVEKAAELVSRCHHVELVEGAEGLADRMRRADMALCSGGIAMFELACVGTPSVVWCQVPHELHNARLFRESGIVRCIGLGATSGPEVAVQALCSLAGDPAARRAMSRAGQTTVDGRGLDRVMEAIEQCVQQYSL